MNPLEILWSYQALSDGQKMFLRLKRIDASMSLAEWIAFLGGLARFDRRADALCSYLLWGGVISVLISIFCAVFFESGWPLLLILGSIYVFVARSRLKGLDLPSLIGRFLLPYLVVLREEVTKDSKLWLKLDLRGFGLREKLTAESGPARNHVRVYRDQWLTGSASLADGAALHWTIIDQVRSRSRERRNARGKTKTKTKSKVRRSINACLQVKHRDYVLNQGEAPGPAVKQKIKAGEKRDEIRTQLDFYPVSAETPPELSQMIDAIASAYRNLSVAEPSVSKA